MGGTARISSFTDAVSASRRVRSSAEAFDYSNTASQSGNGQTHSSLNIKGAVRECLDTEAMPKVTPIAIGMDVTRSRGNDAKTVYEQLEQMLGAIHLSGAAVDPQLLFAAIGDANSDRAPLQVGQFESDERMDGDLERLWLEEGGGGTGEESYELFAYFMARKTAVDAIDQRGEKGFCFITGDEAPYPVVSRDQVKKLIGDELDADIPTSDIFAELQRRYNTYLVFPSKSMEDRKDDIDAEIRQRLLKAGGRFENCSIRASLIWHTRDDLDLHVITPSGDHIYYGDRKDRTGGELDVDRNVRGETREPVENTRWPKGLAQPGKYHVFVRNYGYHEAGRKNVPFVVELDIDGEIQRFEGKTLAGKTGPGSDVTAFEFTYDPADSVQADSESRAGYADEVILAKWRECIPDAHILRVKEASSSTEVMTGVMAMQNGVMDLEGFLGNMHERAVPRKRIEDVKKALQSFAEQGVFNQVEGDVFS